MAEEHIAGVIYEQEQTADRGGAAVMEMILRCPNVGLPTQPPPSPPSQADLYNYAHGQNDPAEGADTWHIDPQGLRAALLHYVPATFKNTFNIHDYAATDRATANQKIIDTIHNFQVPPAVLVKGDTLVSGGHQWVTVRGYRTDGNGALETLWIDDPSPPVSSGGTGIAEQPVSASDWNTNPYWFQPVGGGVRWNNRLTMVTDPKPPEGELRSAVEKPRADGSKILSPDEAISLAYESLKERGLLEGELFARAVRDGKPARPQLVQVTNQEDQFYYLIRYQIDGLDTAVVAFDARFGTFREAIAYSEPLRFFKLTPRDIPRLLSKGIPLEERLETVRDRIISRLLQNINLVNQPDVILGRNLPQLHEMLDRELARFRQPIRQLVIRPEEINVHPVMVWQPAAQSSSLLYPFYQVNTPARRIYVQAADAALFTDWGVLRFLPLGG